MKAYKTSKHHLPTTQQITHGHHQMINTEIVFFWFLCSQRWRSSIQSGKTKLGADCGSDHELLIGKFRHKLKKVGKTTRSFRYDLNQSLTIMWKWQIDSGDQIRQSALRAMDGGLWYCAGGSDQDHPQEKEMQKVMMVVWGGLTNSWEKKRS